MRLEPARGREKTQRVYGKVTNSTNHSGPLMNIFSPHLFTLLDVLWAVSWLRVAWQQGKTPGSRLAKICWRKTWNN